MPGTITSGMDVQAVRAMAQELTRAGQEIQQLTQRITALVTNAPWVGPDYARFTGDWNGRQAALLRQVATSLTDAGRIATQNAQDQEATSGR